LNTASNIAATRASSVQNSTLRKISIRITSYLTFVYLLSVIGRSNVGIAALQMNHDLNIGAAAFGLGAGLFFLGYAIFEVPSNLALHKVGARIWFGRIMISWGLIASALGLTQGAHSFHILRFLLGAAEAGYFPGIVYFMTLWCPASNRAKPYAYFMSFSVFAYICVGPLSTWLMTISNGLLGFPGWRWLFVLEGMPCVILGIFTMFYLVDSPAKAKWLTAEEKAWLIGALEAERRAAPPVEHHSLGTFLKDGKVWIMAGAYFWWNLGNLGVLFWLPTLLKTAHSSWSNQLVGYLYAIPYIFSFVGVYILVWLTRKTGDRGMVLILCSVFPFLALTISAWSSSTLLSFGMICFAAFFYMAVLPIFWTIPAEMLGGKTAAGGIAFISSTTGIGGLLGSWVIGLIEQATGKFEWAIEAMAVAFLLQGVFIVAMRIEKRKPGTEFRLGM